MDIVVTGRRCHISPEFRAHVEEKLGGVERFRDRIQRVEVQVSAETTRGRDAGTTVDITMQGSGPVVRATAWHEEKEAAFELAFDKLKGQVRKAADRRKDHGKRLRSTGLAEEFVEQFPAPTPEPAHEEPRTLAGDVQVTGDGPLVLREKSFPATPLTLAQALDEMELVGHDFFLYVDAESQRPSVVYRRKGYTYGVIHLDVA